MYIPKAHLQIFTLIKLNVECSSNMIKYLPNLHQRNSKKKRINWKAREIHV